MEVLKKSAFEDFVKFYPELKAICDDLNLKTGEEVLKFLEDTNGENNNIRKILKNKLTVAIFEETFSSRLVERGREAMDIGEGDDTITAANLLVAMFYNKVEKLRKYLKSKDFDFDKLSFDDKFKEFQKTILLEDEIVKTGLCEMFVREFGEIENEKNKNFKKPTPQIQPGSGEE